ncbi:hypothetical protein GCM10008018_45380 [Paenibacillus marchantiophytorum]|uniref:Transposon Tn7 transposition protein TnsD C-terminal domain-containing protein n=1 Tax=Paenibacillus marchantiophytorum TaxID=1619310 RepID=A0ABQ1EZ26_9BACL|nr:hypothetical protein GCM10008018_45380 [Paenibacillus marchantiophytorum]
MKPEDRMKIGRIKKFGEIWETKFKELQVHADLSLRQKAAILGVHYSTIQLKLRAPNKVAISVDSASDSIKNPSITRQLNRSLPKSLVEVQPEDDVKKDKRNSRPLRIDWSCRDRELAPFILQAVIDIKTSNHKPIRVTISEIGRRMNKLSLLEKKLHCLPVCKNILDDAVETIEQFQLRRIRLAVEKLYQEDASVVRWKVIRKAGLRKEAAQKLQIEIDRLVNEHNASQWRRNTQIV